MSRRIFQQYQLLLKSNVHGVPGKKWNNEFYWLGYSNVNCGSIEWGALSFLKQFGNYKDVDKLKLQSIITFNFKLSQVIISK